MALVRGVHCGFVTETPEEPTYGSGTQLDTRAISILDTSPAGATKITEIGFHAREATQEANFEVGLYTDEGNSEPEERLYVDTTNAKGTTTGWKSVAVDWSIDAETAYWLAVQLDDTATTTNIYYDSGGILARLYSVNSLPSDWGTSDSKSSNLVAIYAVWEAVGGVEHTHFSTDTLAMSDSLSPAMTFNVALADTHGIADNMAPAMTFNVAVDESKLAMSDSLATPVMKFGHAAADTLAMSDAFGTPVMTFNVALADKLNISDSLAFAATYAVALADTMNMSDALTAGWKFYVSLSDTMSMSDSMDYEAFVAAVRKIRRGQIYGLKPARVVNVGRIGV